ncbi:hypothetical protein FSP39_023264 [Pinctada imbricata]|uniref:Actin n=1 Tax=Pinctada imbricata TaxID=66713 RepID=A0AA88YWB0_PINIB|nr:hypothetical protein FSP39_023264 [Pinctada imbricata]
MNLVAPLEASPMRIFKYEGIELESFRIILKEMVGIPLLIAGMEKEDTEKVYIGEEAHNFRQSLNLQSPTRNLSAIDWAGLEMMLNYTFMDELRLSPEDHPILLVDPQFNLRKNRQKMAEIMFNTFNIPALHMVNQARLALYATNRNTGTILYSGFWETYSVPIIMGEVMSHAILKIDVGFLDLLDYLIKILKTPLVADRKTAGKIVGKLGYVALDFEQEMQTAASSSSLDKSYELSDGKVITLGNERFRCPEALFQPSLLGKDISGIHDVIYESIKKCESNYRALFGNIVLSGISTSLPGVDQRLLKEMRALAPPNMDVQIIAVPSKERPDLAWIGGSKLASQKTFNKMVITKEEYKKFGPSVIN